MGEVNIEEARQLVAKHEVEVIDLRDEDGWIGGHIPGAHRGGDDVESELEDRDDDRKLLIVCADGKRSAEVAEELGSGEREAVSLKGGMEAWVSDGMPTQPAQDYEPGPAPIEEGDDEMAAEIVTGTLEPGEDPKPPKGSGGSEDSEDEEDSDGSDDEDGDANGDGDEDPDDEDEAGGGEDDDGNGSLEEPEQQAEDEAGEPVEGASGEESPQQERS